MEGPGLGGSRSQSKQGLGSPLSEEVTWAGSGKSVSQARGRRQEEGAQEEATVGLLWPSAGLFLGQVRSGQKARTACL